MLRWDKAKKFIFWVYKYSVENKSIFNYNNKLKGYIHINEN